MDLQHLIPAAACLAVLGTLAACQAPPPRQPAYSVSVSGAGNRVTPSSTSTEAVFEVMSETGLGSAEVEQVSGVPPRSVLLRLHLKGLEEFSFEYNDRIVIVSVSSYGDQTVSERMRTASSGEMTIAPDSPYWMPVRLVGSPGSGGPDSTGYFELHAPQEFVQSEHPAFSMRWIDFYR